MGSKTFKKIAVPLVALALGAVPVSAAAAPNIDYTKNGATGVYAPEIVHKDYTKNGATGDYAPAVNVPKHIVPIAPVTAPDDGFSWSAAAVGALAVLLLVMLVGITTRRVRRRRVPAPTPARPSAA
jgi:hypothetical protein